VSDEVKKQWKVIQTFGRKKSGHETEDYWNPVLAKSFKVFLAMTSDEDDLETNIRYFVSQFGKHDTEADFRWLVAHWGGICGPSAGTEPHDAVEDPHWHRIQCEFAKQQVFVLLKDKKYLRRYQRAVVWHELFYARRILSIRIGVTKRKISKRDVDDYWWHARNAILLIHATERDDLLKDADPAKLDEVYAEWQKWLKANGVYLRARENGVTWYLDEGAKKRNEIRIRFLTREELPELEVKQPFKGFDVPDVWYFLENE
jgi:hypothetical protein